jgi:D-alanyl-D-alanine carboxypeptidase
MRHAIKAAMIVCSAAWMCGTANAASSPVPIEPIASCMTRAAADLGFNGSVYARLGDVVAQKSFGTSDAAGRVPVTSRTRFSMASASKMFTAVAIGQLVDQGAIRFDAPIGSYLSGLKPELAAITIAQLLNHTSGLGDYFRPENQAVIDAATTATDLLPLALATSPAFAPGSRRAYSNSGFVVLGAIVEKVSGMTYAEYVQKRIFAPAGMTDTRLDAQDRAEPMTRMSPAGMLDKPQPSPLQALRASPAGGASITPTDVSAFLTALTAGRLVSRATMTALTAPRPDPTNAAHVYGYGFDVRETSPRRVGHGGGAPGMNAEIALYPESGWQMIALSNNDPPTASRMVEVLEKTIFASDPDAACTTALADPGLHEPMVMPRH